MTDIGTAPHPARPRICLITRSFPASAEAARDGWGTYAWNARIALSYAGADVDVVCLADDEPGCPAQPEQQIHQFQARWVRWLSWFAPGVAEGWQLLGFIRRLDGDRPFLAIEGPNVDGLCWALALRERRRFWLRIHTSLEHTVSFGSARTPWRGRFRHWLDGATARLAAHRITHSQRHREQSRHEYRLGKGRIEVVAHGTTVRRDDSFRTPDLPRGAHLLAIGSLTPRKAYPVLFAAFEAMLRDVPDARLVVVGPDPEGRLPEYAVAFPKAFAATRFAGVVNESELEALWTSSRVAVIASHYESFGLVAIEAMARGVPLVATDGGALPEVIGDAGVIVPAGDSAALAEALVRAWQDRALAAKLSDLGLARYRDRFTLDQMGRQMLALFTGQGGQG